MPQIRRQKLTDLFVDVKPGLIVLQNKSRACPKCGGPANWEYIEEEAWKDAHNLAGGNTLTCIDCGWKTWWRS
jgi:predicted RNA-binding Zn-ribbon protein involved in translation (DUF1610 family)